MISNIDLQKVQEAVLDIKDMRDKGIKARKDITLENGVKLSVYHLGQSNKTIRLDLKFE